MEVSLGKSLINGPGIKHANGQYTVNTGDEFQLKPEFLVDFQLRRLMKPEGNQKIHGDSIKHGAWAFQAHPESFTWGGPALGYPLGSPKPHPQYPQRQGSVRNRLKLVGGLEHFLVFHILGRIIPIDELIFFKGLKPPTRKLLHKIHTGLPSGTQTCSKIPRLLR